MRGSLLVAFTAVLSSCGSGGATKSDFDAYCEAYCGWRSRCGSGGSDCVDVCQSGWKADYGRYRATAVRAITDCFAVEQNCGSDDRCFGEGVRAVVPNPESDERYLRCRATRTQCESSPFSDDSCATLLVLTSVAQQDFEACYAKPCDEMRACVKSVTGGD